MTEGLGPGEGGVDRQTQATEPGRGHERKCQGVRSRYYQSWPQGSPDVQGSESPGESNEGVCAEGVCPVSSTDVAAPGRGPAGPAGSPLPLLATSPEGVLRCHPWDNAPGWPLFLAFSSCERLSGAGGPEGAGQGLGPTSRGWAAPAHRHRSCLCPAGSMYCIGGPLWAKATPGTCHSPQRASSPKAGGRHLPHPMANAGLPGQSGRHSAGPSRPWLLSCARWAWAQHR